MTDFAALPRQGGFAASFALVRHRPLAVGAACAGAAASGLLGLLPYLAAWALADRWLGGSAFALDGAGFAAALAGGLVLRHALAFASRVLAHRLAFDAIIGLKRWLLDKLDRVPLSYFDQQPALVTAQLIGRQTDELEDAIAHLLPEMTSAILVPLVLSVLLLWADWRLGLACLAPYALAIFFSVRSMAVGKEAGQAMMRAWGQLMRTLGGLVGGQLLLRIHDQDGAALRRVDASLTEFGLRSEQAVRQPLGHSVLFMVLGTCALSVVLLAGGALWYAGDLSLSTLVFFLVVSIGLGSLYSDVFGFFLRLGKLNAIWKQLFALMDAPEQAWGASGIRPADHGFEVRQLTYLQGGRTILDTIDLTIPSGSSLALVGPSGSGKTTLARLFMRYDDPSEGDILFGGRPLADYDRDTLWGRMAFVSQHTELFALSVLDNIRLGRPDAGEDEVVAASRATLCHDFIMALPDGYRTVLEEGGRNLSGGQRQRLALARALLLDAPVLILDEALAFSDIENEVLIQRALSRLAKGRTLVVIAHRLPSVRALDAIVVLDGGRIAERGRHDQLVAANGRYAALWRRMIGQPEQEATV
ncbi:ABC transporter ATP-binding protein [Paludibacterium paludis]|uniref:HlyB/MsbA family ABC transporter n=1 Tax=Paludibacterium paludis TaxID=1225769 RepID=A0A918UAS7_9NEIS|nr:ABC transporter ATP-binding protein [Paludibacterium paludis]GGY18458.1 HlyB/MsbA family ABC transporter [Paludibacterium paludis]